MSNVLKDSRPKSHGTRDGILTTAAAVGTASQAPKLLAATATTGGKVKAALAGASLATVSVYAALHFWDRTREKKAAMDQFNLAPVKK